MISYFQGPVWWIRAVMTGRRVRREKWAGPVAVSVFCPIKSESIPVSPGSWSHKRPTKYPSLSLLSISLTPVLYSTTCPGIDRYSQRKRSNPLFFCFIATERRGYPYKARAAPSISQFPQWVAARTQPFPSLTSSSSLSLPRIVT